MFDVEYKKLPAQNSWYSTGPRGIEHIAYIYREPVIFGLTFVRAGKWHTLLVGEAAAVYGVGDRLTERQRHLRLNKR